MSLVRVHCFSLSADGYAAGPNQNAENPLGAGGMALHEWFFKLNPGQLAQSPDSAVDESFLNRARKNVGATIIGRNMFGPLRGPWQDENWKGWWGDSPPYDGEVFVLTHFERPSFTIGNTTFHFVTGGIDEAMASARRAAGDKDVLIGGGISVLQQYLKAEIVDLVHLVVTPVFLGRGESLTEGLDLPELGYQVTEIATGDNTLHVVLERRKSKF